VAVLRKAGNATSQCDLSRKAVSQCDLASVGKFARSNREMRCMRGLQANQTLRGVQLSKTQMERLASLAMARFLYKGPGPCVTRSSAVDAQSRNAQASILPQSYAACAQPCGRENLLVLNGFGRAVAGRGQGFRNFMLSAQRGYLLGRSSRGIVSVRGSGAQGEGNNGFDRDSRDASFFGKSLF
jgi:hypothetical protein